MMRDFEAVVNTTTCMTYEDVDSNGVIIGEVVTSSPYTMRPAESGIINSILNQRDPRHALEGAATWIREATVDPRAARDMQDTTGGVPTTPMRRANV